MGIDDKYHFGLNKGLTLKEVYQGTPEIDRKLLKDFLLKCLKSKLVPKSEEFSLFELKIDEDKIEVIPEIFNPEISYSEQNQVYLGNIAEKIEIYFNHFFNPNWYGIITHFQEFNSGKCVIGGNPEYILWCINKAEDFNIDLTTLRELESLKVYRLKRLKLEMTKLNHYKYTTIIEEEFFKFKIQLFPSNQH